MTPASTASYADARSMLAVPTMKRLVDVVLLSSLAMATAGMLAGCDDKTTFKQVPVEGLPRCDQSKGLNLLMHPVMVEISDGGDRNTRVVMGTKPQPTLSVAEKNRTWKLRAGVCGLNPVGSSSYQCKVLNWYHEAELEVDAAKVGSMKISLPAPPDKAKCWSDAPKTQ